MATNEVNDIVVRLLAAADKIGGRDREEILHHVGRLSRAATRERTAAVDEMQKLRKKVVQQGAELRRLEDTTHELRRLENLNLKAANTCQTVPTGPAAQASKAAQPPLVSSHRGSSFRAENADASCQAGGYARYTESRLQALSTGSETGQGLDYGPDYGRLTRPESLPQPKRKSTAAPNDPRVNRREQQLAPAGMSAASAAQPQDTAIEEQPGYGHFNQARFSALQASSAATTPSGEPGERSSLSDGPAPPKYSVTDANAEPVAPRGKHRSESIEGTGSAMQAVDQLFDQISSMAQPVLAGHKRRASETDVTAAAVAKRQLLTTAPPANSDGTHRIVTGFQTLVPGTVNMAPQAGAVVLYNAPLQWSKPTCTNCFQNGFPDCDGKAHCSQGESHKCYYVLCNPATCQGANCVKIHPSQYDLKQRKSGEPRRLVIGDNESLPGGNWDRRGHGRAVAAMGGAFAMGGAKTKGKQPLAGLPAPTQGIHHAPQGHITGGNYGSQGHHPFKVAKTVRWASSRFSPASMSDPARSAPSSDAPGIKVETSEG